MIARQTQRDVKAALRVLDDRLWESLNDLDLASVRLLESMGWTLAEWEARDEEDD